MASRSLATSRTARSACSFALAQRVPPSVFSGLRVRRFQPPRPLHFVAPEDFCIGDNYQLSFIGKESAAEIANLDVRKQLFVETVFFPDFAEALLLAIVVAKDMHHILLPQP